MCDIWNMEEGVQSLASDEKVVRLVDFGDM